MVSAIFLGLVLSTHRGMIDARDQITKANKHAILPWRDIAHMPFLPASSFAFRVWKYLSRLYLRDRKREHVRGQHFGFIDAITVNFFICLRCRSHLSCRINISGAICKRHVCANGPKWSLLSLEHITLPFFEVYGPFRRSFEGSLSHLGAASFGKGGNILSERFFCPICPRG